MPFWIALGLYGAVVAGWWLRHVLISLVDPLDLRVRPRPDARDNARCVSVVIAARNERARLAPCIRSVLAQGPVVRELIVVDDRSDDGTAEVARQAAGSDDRLRIIRIDQLADGWSGKAHACQAGGLAAEAPWLLFADADCRLRSGGISGAVAYAERRNIDLLSLWIAAQHESFWEHMLIPLCGALILYWFPPMLANAPRSRLGYANGQFILVRQSRYREMGGHASTRAAVIEDIPLAQHAKRSGLRLRTALGPDIVSVRMYTGFREIVDGWTRIFIGALQQRWKLLASIGSLLGGSLLPSIAAPLVGWWVLTHGWPLSSPLRVLFSLLLLHFAGVYSVSYRAWGLCRCRRVYLWLYPVSVVIVIAILARAWWWMTIRKPVVWRGAVTGPGVAQGSETTR